MAISPFIAIYVNEYLGASEAETGIIIGVFYITSAIMITFIGLTLSDGAILPVMISSLFALSLISWAYTIASLPTIIPLRIIHGLASGTFMVTSLTIPFVATTSMSDLSTEQETSRALTYYTAAISLGLLGGPLVSSFVLRIASIRETMFISSAIYMLVGMLGLTCMKRGVLARNRFPNPRHDMRDFFMTIHNKETFSVLVTYASFAFLYGVFTSYAPLRAKLSFIILDTMVAIMFFGHYAASFISRLALGRFMLKMKVKLLVFGLLIAFVAMLTMSLSSALWIFALGFISLGISHGLIFPTTLLLIAKGGNQKSRLLGNAMGLLAFMLGNLSGCIVGSFLVTDYGIPSVLSFSCLPLLLGLVLALFVAKNMHAK
jgi:MFS family permease